MAVYQLFGVSTTKNDVISSTGETAITAKMYTIQSSDEIMTATAGLSYSEETTAPWNTRIEKNSTNMEQRPNFSIKTTVPPSIRGETFVTNITYSLETTEPYSANYVNKGISDVTIEPTLLIETTQWYTSNLPLNYCKCPCHTVNSKWKNILHSNISKQEILYLIEDEVKEIQKEIAIDKTATSAYLRRKSSATDKRTSSVTVGILAVIIIVVALMFFVCFDCVSVYQKINN
ncbi:uncharacterized protein LOC134709553 [Mytilus trossulus]|uniref:uncharacterized protein LOC134709553 n=1 Tax=Mytilus trossulus TaxID=6551 RepID=UPI0030054162